MNESPDDPTQWSRRRWMWTIFGLFIVQLVAFVWLLNRGVVVVAKPSVNVTPVEYIPETILNGDIAEAFALNDPAIFARPHPQNFSGSAWLKPPAFPYATTNVVDSPIWLGSPEKGLGEFFALIRSREEGDEAGSPAHTARSLPLIVSDVSTSSLFDCEIQLFGGIGGCRLISTNSVPIPESEQAMSNCVVQVVVSSVGTTFSAAVTASSGSQRADEGALNFAKNARFSLPSADAEAEYQFLVGEMVFSWRSIPISTKQLSSSR